MKIICFILIFIPLLLFAQTDSIYEEDIVDAGNILQNYKAPDDYKVSCGTASLRLYNFSDYIYSPKLLKILNKNGTVPQWVESSSIEKGAWGRGFFTKWVDSYLFSKIDTVKTNYNALWNGEGTTTKYYRQTNPDLSYCSKALLFTIYWCKSHTISKKNLNKIKDGLIYLLSKQQADGGFIQYWFRKSQTDPTPDPNLNRETSYSTADVLRAIVEGYYFLKENSKYNNKELLSTLKRAIVRSGDYLMSKQCSQEEGNNNYKCFSIWGLASAYKVTGNKALMDCAISKYYEIRKNQNSDGAWYIAESDQNNSSITNRNFHDTHPCYMGIILRGLGELYSILPYDLIYKDGVRSAKADIKKSICLTINNFLRFYMRNDSSEPRLSITGKIWPYKSETEYVGGTFYGLNLIHGLKYIENCNDSLKLNPHLLSQFIKILMTAHKNQINSSNFADEGNHDDDMVSFGLELVPRQLSSIYSLRQNPSK